MDNRVVCNVCGQFITDGYSAECVCKMCYAKMKRFAQIYRTCIICRSLCKGISDKLSAELQEAEDVIRSTNAGLINRKPEYLPGFYESCFAEILRKQEAKQRVIDANMTVDWLILHDVLSKGEDYAEGLAYGRIADYVRSILDCTPCEIPNVLTFFLQWLDEQTEKLFEVQSRRMRRPSESLSVALEKAADIIGDKNNFNDGCEQWETVCLQLRRLRSLDCTPYGVGWCEALESLINEMKNK